MELLWRNITTVSAPIVRRNPTIWQDKDLYITLTWRLRSCKYQGPVWPDWLVISPLIDCGVTESHRVTLYSSTKRSLWVELNEPLNLWQDVWCLAWGEEGGERWAEFSLSISGLEQLCLPVTACDGGSCSGQWEGGRGRGGSISVFQG